MFSAKSKENRGNAGATGTESAAHFAEYVDGIWRARRDRRRVYGFRFLVALAAESGHCRERKNCAGCCAARRGRKIRRSARRQRIQDYKFLRDAREDSKRRHRGYVLRSFQR